jgi:HAD superfamily hydrolase (TIGR01509 family)
MPLTSLPATTPANAFDARHGIQAVLWDMDGTIVDTEPYWIAAEKALVHAHGGSWTDEDALRLVGQALPTSAGMLQEAGVRLEIREIIDILTQSVCDGVRESVPWRPGARELLEDLAGHGVPCAMVTMSEGPLAGLVADALPEGTFRFRVTGDMVRRGKPHPEPYLLALDRLGAHVPGVDPRRVVAIEDSAPGVASASASGATTIAVPHFLPLPASEDWALWPTLHGVTAPALDTFVRSRNGGAGGGAVELP